MISTLDEVRDIVSFHSGISLEKLTAQSAIDQDIRIAGEDVTDLAQTLANRYGDQVWQWPWHRFALLDEGLSLWFPVMLIWQLISWPVRGSFEYPSLYERLELGHIAAVIEKGKWFEP
jgi:hypothetical protein